MAVPAPAEAAAEGELMWVLDAVIVAVVVALVAVAAVLMVRDLVAAVRNRRGEVLVQALLQAKSGTRPGKELPSIASLGGKHPDLTGELGTEEYMRTLRGPGRMP